MILIIDKFVNFTDIDHDSDSIKGFISEALKISGVL